MRPFSFRATTPFESGKTLDQPRHVLIRFHEVALKGKNRPWFIRALVEAVRRATHGLGVERVWAGQMMVRLTLAPDADWEAVSRRLATVSGVVKFSLAHRTQPGYPAIERLVLDLTRSLQFGSFRITAHRADKQFPLTSREMNVRLGDAVRLSSSAKVDLSNPGLTVRVEVLPREVFVYAREEPGPGGLPVGTSDRTVTLMSGGIDSPVAAWRMIHRGCITTLVHFHSFPLVEGRSREKAKELAEAITGYQYDTRLYLVPFAELQKRVVLAVPGPLRVVAYRRFMLRIAEAIARREGAIALVTGESLGQVSSQTLQNMATIEQAASIPVLRPLVGMDKQEIIDQARRIGTYDISILPDEDCCSLFVPRSPSTRTYVGQMEPLEATLGVEELVQQAVAGAELFEYHADSRVATSSAVRAAGLH